MHEKKGCFVLSLYLPAAAQKICKIKKTNLLDKVAHGWYNLIMYQCLYALTDFPCVHIVHGLAENCKRKFFKVETDAGRTI